MRVLSGRYAALLASYVESPTEAQLLEAGAIGRALVTADVPPEEAVEMHEKALDRLLAGLPADVMPQAARLSSAPLMEVFVAYGLAFRDRVESLRRAESEVRESQQFLATVIDTAAALVVVLDGQGRIVRFNPACERATGYTAADAQGRTIWELLSVPGEAERDRGAFERVRAGAPGDLVESTWLARDGSRRLVSWSLAAVRDADGAARHVIATGIDVSAQRVMEVQAEHQERLAAVGQLAAGVAHEIGNPLAALSGAVEVLHGRAKEPAMAERLAMVSRQVERIWPS